METEGGVKLSRPDNPATLPTFDDIEPIADGLTPETGTLKVFNYEEYIASATAVRGCPLRRSAGHVAANPSKEML